MGEPLRAQVLAWAVSSEQAEPGAGYAELLYGIQGSGLDNVECTSKQILIFGKLSLSGGGCPCA